VSTHAPFWQAELCTPWWLGQSFPHEPQFFTSPSVQMLQSLTLGAPHEA
jgi:hypothetical protein